MNDANFTYDNIMITDSDEILDNNSFIDVENTINSTSKPGSATKNMTLSPTRMILSTATDTKHIVD